MVPSWDTLAGERAGELKLPGRLSEICQEHENLESHKHESFVVCLYSKTLGNRGQTLSKCSLHKFVYRGRTNKIEWKLISMDIL